MKGLLLITLPVLLCAGCQGIAGLSKAAKAPDRRAETGSVEDGYFVDISPWPKRYVHAPGIHQEEYGPPAMVQLDCGRMYNEQFQFRQNAHRPGDQYARPAQEYSWP